LAAAGFLAADFLAAAGVAAADLTGAGLPLALAFFAAAFFFTSGTLTAIDSPSGVATTRVSEEAFNGAAAGLMGNKQ
jgi:hypothetical protein